MRQIFLDEYLRQKKGGRKLEKTINQLTILNWNIAHPSLIRAYKISEWIERQENNILILTETSDSPGCNFLADRLESLGFTVIFNKKEDDFGSMLAFRDFVGKTLNIGLAFLPHRVPAIICNTPIGELGIIGVYVPSSVSRKEINGKKERFQKEFTKVLSEQKQKLPNLIVCGDLNVLEPNHQPHYSFLRNWEYEFYESFGQMGFVDAFRLFYPDICEYSWYGREGYGYRYDHSFISKELKKYTKSCCYIHEPRKNHLSDHSAMIIKMDFQNPL